MTSSPLRTSPIHIRKHPDNAKQVWCGRPDVASISEAWGYYGANDGYDQVCTACINAKRKHSK
jgi:hypothetical protein